MIHHVTLEVSPADVEASLEFWRLAGFAEVEPPDDLKETFAWVERGGTQIHLMRTESPIVPTDGHVAIVAPDFEATVERLRAAGFEVSPKRQRWGSPRGETIAPGGHRVELMQSPPGG